MDRDDLRRAQDGWVAPAELMTPLPRGTRLVGGGRTAYRISRFALLALAAATLYLVGTAVRDAVIESRLRNQGLTANARIERKWQRKGTKAANYVRYTFDSAGRFWIREVNLPLLTYNQLREGGSAPVRYWPADPRQNRLAGEHHWAAYLPLLFVVAVSTFLAWALGHPAVTQKRLLESGIPAVAIVTRVTGYKNRETATFEFLDMSGNACIAQTTIADDHAPEAASVVTVLYDPARPYRATLYPAKLAVLT